MEHRRSRALNMISGKLAHESRAIRGRVHAVVMRGIYSN
jgi:hypothetical protein